MQDSQSSFDKPLPLQITISVSCQPKTQDTNNSQANYYPQVLPPSNQNYPFNRNDPYQYANMFGSFLALQRANSQVRENFMRQMQQNQVYQNQNFQNKCQPNEVAVLPQENSPEIEFRSQQSFNLRNPSGEISILNNLDSNRPPPVNPFMNKSPPPRYSLGDYSLQKTVEEFFTLQGIEAENWRMNTPVLLSALKKLVVEIFLCENPSLLTKVLQRHKIRSLSVILNFKKFYSNNFRYSKKNRQ